MKCAPATTFTLLALLAVVLCACGATVTPLVAPLRYADAPALRSPTEDAPLRLTR